MPASKERCNRAMLQAAQSCKREVHANLIGAAHNRMLLISASGILCNSNEQCIFHFNVLYRICGAVYPVSNLVLGSGFVGSKKSNRNIILL